MSYEEFITYFNIQDSLRNEEEFKSLLRLELAPVEIYHLGDWEESIIQ